MLYSEAIGTVPLRQRQALVNADVLRFASDVRVRRQSVRQHAHGATGRQVEVRAPVSRSLVQRRQTQASKSDKGGTITCTSGVSVIGSNSNTSDCLARYQYNKTAIGLRCV